jgi:hypothetical protein
MAIVARDDNRCYGIRVANKQTIGIGVHGSMQVQRKEEEQEEEEGGREGGRCVCV